MVRTRAQGVAPEAPLRAALIFYPAHVDVIVFAREPKESHLLIESYGGHIEHTHLDDRECFDFIAHSPCEVLLYTRNHPPIAGDRLQLQPATCVTLAKAVIGCRSWLVQTPGQLRRWILKNGGYSRGSQETKEVCRSEAT